MWGSGTHMPMPMQTMRHTEANGNVNDSCKQKQAPAWMLEVHYDVAEQCIQHKQNKFIPRRKKPALQEYT